MNTLRTMNNVEIRPCPTLHIHLSTFAWHFFGGFNVFIKSFDIPVVAFAAVAGLRPICTNINLPPPQKMSLRCVAPISQRMSTCLLIPNAQFGGRHSFTLCSCGKWHPMARNINFPLSKFFIAHTFARGLLAIVIQFSMDM